VNRGRSRLLSFPVDWSECVVTDILAGSLTAQVLAGESDVANHLINAGSKRSSCHGVPLRHDEGRGDPIDGREILIAQADG
jgi:hypothetical protein